MSFIPKPHEIYKHFKGNLYQVTAIAEHTETGEQLVVYQALYGDVIYARPLSMFVSRVDREKYPDAVQEFRFELQGPEAARQRKESGEAERQEKTLTDVHMEVTDAQAEGRAATGGQNKCDSQAAPVGQKGLDRDKATAGQEKLESQLSGTGSEISGQNEEALTIDPLVLEFLDADSYGEQLNILAGLHHRITNEMITTMAIACDIEINDGDVEERYEALKTCLLTLERYECNRLR